MNTPTSARLRGVVRLRDGTASHITDADEEVFLLYTKLAAHASADGSSSFRGLGHIDSHEDALTVSLKLDGSAVTDGRGGERHQETERGMHKTRKTRSHSHKAEDVKTVEIEIFQDKTALRSRKGDTGSVLWHASVDFAEVILQQLHHNDPEGLFDHDLLSNAHVLELGAGTGLLSIALSPFVSRYTVTDIPDLVPLIRKNVGHNLPHSPPTKPHPRSPHKPKHAHPPQPPPPPPQQPMVNVTATALDWVQLQQTSASLRPRLVPEDAVDVLLIVDCIYHPSLLPALVTTMDYLTTPGRTAVVVVVELRAEDVIREFLQEWINQSSEWEIWSIEGLLKGPYAVWIGWKDASNH